MNSIVPNRRSFLTTHLISLTLHLTILLFLLLSLTACELIQPAASPASPLPTPTLPPLALAVDVRDDAIIVPIPADPPSFNAYLNNTGYEALIGELVYGSLAEIGPDGNYYPELAAKLPTLANGGLGEEGRTVTWQLRPGLHWSDGEPFTSGDVRFTWQALRDSGIWAPGFDLIDNIEAPDPLTAIIHYREFYPNYLIQFGGQGTGVLPAHHCGDPAKMLFWDCNFEPVSTGPFVLAQWIPGVRLIFEPNPNYFIPERPLASQLVFEIEPDPDLRQRQLERGNVYLDLWPDDPVLSRMEQSGNIIIFYTNPARYVLRLVPNLSAPGSADPDIPHPALADVRVRQAIRYAIDTGRLNEEAFNNRGRPVSTELFQFDCNLTPYPYNSGLAAALLDEAGWVLKPDENVRRCQGCGTAEEGAPLVLTSYIYAEFGNDLDTAHRLIKGMLAEVGIELQRQVVEGGQLWDTWANNGLELRGNFDLDLWDDGYYGVDPTLYLSDYFDPRAIPTRDNPVAGLNVSRYRNLDLIDIFDALHTPLPDNRRRVLLCELATVLYHDLPHIPLLALPDVYAINPALQGVSPHIYDTVTWNAGDWYLAPSPPE
ncbi:MAG: peptide ABC transporter substrate-binding protein [Anaerolineae bacterium]|nr:peptide ABC transporter substrate-binding protein [Anaerolineae bacterium]